MTIPRPFAPSAVVVCAVLMLCTHVCVAGSPSSVSQSLPGLSSALQQKVGSGNLIRQIARKISSTSTATRMSRPAPFIMAAVYASAAPSGDFLSRLSSKGVRAFPETWTPPSAAHPFGFFLAQIPAAVITDVLAIDDVKKMDTAECESEPMSNEAARAIKADAAWAKGITGSGIRVGVLDSGLDITYAGSELPAFFQKRDYSTYPSIDTVIGNTVTGHGTHVAGIVLARGVLSPLNTANGGGAYKGMAPGADLVFLKIGLDGNGGAYDAAEIVAIHAAVDTFHVALLNLSYGGWDAYHDGSNIVSQAIDWAYSRGVACFVAAGNYGAAARHASGSVGAHDTSGFIQVTVGASENLVQLAFNLVWSDGPARNDLSLLYYNDAKTLLTDVTRYSTTESARGTESQCSEYNQYIRNRPGTYYLRVVNPSSVEQGFHIYENSNRGFVFFAFPDPNFTITTPGDADNAFTVGAYSAHETWIGADGSVNHTGIPLNIVAPFSSRGPRVDGAMKPNITAPGSMLISLRDRDVYSTTTPYCVDDDGIAGGAADYYVMQGTSMASPVCAGAAALLYQQAPLSTPRQIYDALMQKGASDTYTGIIPNTSAGFGKLDVYAALQEMPLPVELTSFSSILHNESVVLAWRTATETNNYGFEIERSRRSADFSASASPASDPWMRVGFVPGGGTTTAPLDYSYVDRLPSSGTFAYRLKQIDRDGRFAYSNELEVRSGAIPVVFSLSQNYPNPFNPSTNFRFSIPAESMVRLCVFDVLGREVGVVVNRHMKAGSYTESWNASQLPGGVYFYRLEAGTYGETKKLLLQK